MSTSSVVLLSGGLDSTVNLYEARSRGSVALALTFDYGQRAAPREIELASAQCRDLGVSHRVLSLPWFSHFTHTSLVNTHAPVPIDIAIDNLKASQKSAEAVWVPNRNGIFLNIAAGYAEGLRASVIVPGFNREEAATFPDNSRAYLEAATQSLYYSTSNHVRIECYTTHLNKTEIVRRGRELQVNFDLVWPCYFSNEKPCGHCESCLRYQRAHREA